VNGRIIPPIYRQVRRWYGLCCRKQAARAYSDQLVLLLRRTVMELIGTIIGWAVFGLIIGAIARLLYPGERAMSIWVTMVLGIAGSLLGGFISWAIWGAPGDSAFQGAGWIMSIVGALIVVWIGLFTSNKYGMTGRGTM